MITRRLLSCKILEVRRELLKYIIRNKKRVVVDETDLLKVGDMAAKMVGWFRPPVFGLIPEKKV
jgi:hypothetical protein